MTVYYIAFFFLVMLCTVSYKVHNKQFLFLLRCILLLIIAGFRNATVGNDLNGYVLQFIGATDRGGEKVNIELVWTLINNFLYFISNDPSWFIFATSFLTLIPIFIFISKQSEQPSFSLLFLFIIQIGFCFFMTGIRQSMAMSLTLWTFYFFDKKKYLVSSLFLALAVGIHASAIFILPFLFLSKIEIRKTLLVIILALSVFFGFVFRFDIFASFRQIMFLFPAFSFYEGYSDYYVERIPNFFGLFFAIVPLSIFSYYGITKRNDFFSKILFWGTVFNNVFASTPQLPRYFLYLTIYQIIIIPNIYKQLSSTNKIIVLFVILILCYYFLGVPKITGTTPYKLYYLNY